MAQAQGRARNTGPLVTVESPCIDCGQPWQMHQSEIDWWKREAAAQGLKFPKRCPACRAKKKEFKKTSPLHTASSRLRAIAETLLNGEPLQDDELAAELMEMANTIERSGRN